MAGKKIIGVVGPRNSRIGEDHQNAKLTDAHVEEIRELHDTGKWGYRKLADKFGVHRMTIRDIVTFRRRACTPDAYKPVYKAMTAIHIFISKPEDFDFLD
jgi:IS30 family transposase